MSLKEEGYRFIYQDGLWSWQHPAIVKPGAIDATDLDDEAFEALVAAQEGSK